MRTTPSVTDVRCPTCKRMTLAFVPATGPRVLTYIKHHRPDGPVVAFVKRLLPWTSEPFCERSEKPVWIHEVMR